MRASDIIGEDAARVCDAVDLRGLQDKEILITGASGLIGTHLAACLAHLQSRGPKLRVYAQMRSEPPPHLQRLLQSAAFEVLRLDLADFRTYPQLPRVDVVIHAAGYGQPGRFLANPGATIAINTSGTAALIQCLRGREGRFLFLSTSEVYSGLHKEALVEGDIGTTTPEHPRACYIEGKRCGEAICNAVRAQGGLVASARVALAYGPGTRKHDKRALNSFIERALCQKRIELMDAGQAVRTYCYISDTVEMLWRILLLGREGVYNVGGRSTVSILELAQLIGNKTGAVVSCPAKATELAGAPEEVRLDLSRVETEFGKRQYMSLDEGLEKTIAWQRELYAGQAG